MISDAKPGPGPELILQLINGFRQTAALKTAFELDLFTAIAEGDATPRRLAQRLHAAERGVRILCDYLVVHGLLTKQDNAYSLVPGLAMFLDRRSPSCLGSLAHFLTSPQLTEAFQHLTDAVRKGGSIREEGILQTENPFWLTFARNMVPLMIPAAEEIAALVGADKHEKWKVLDIAAGHGMFGITIALKNPNARIVAQDWRNILAVAQENADGAALGDRYRLLPGNAFEVDFGSDYDLGLLTNFLHHFDAPACEKLLAKVHRALKPGGRLVILDFIPNEDRVSPPLPASFGLAMLVSTPSGDAYTFSEYQTMLEHAGFSRSTLHLLKDSPEQVILSHKD